MKISEARSLTKKWQERLGLQHWVIKVRWRLPSDLDDFGFTDEMQGAIHWFTHRDQAIMILRKDATPQTVVHEILHVRIQSHKPVPKRYDIAFEKALNVLADALLNETEMWV